MKETRVLISGVRGPGQQGSLLLTSDMLVVIGKWLLIVGYQSTAPQLPSNKVNFNYKNLPNDYLKHITN